MSSKRSVTVSKPLFQSISPILRLNRNLCFFPLQWKQVKDNYVITKSTAFSIYGLTIISLLVIGTINGRVQMIKIGLLKKITESISAALVAYSDMFMVLTSLITSVVVFSFKSNRYIEFIESLKNVDRYLRKHPPKNMFVTYSFTSYAIFLLSIDTFLWWSAVVKTKLSYFVHCTYVLPLYLCYFGYVIVDLVYWQAVNFIAVRLAIFNNRLSELYRSNRVLVLQDGAWMLEQVENLTKAYILLEDATRTVNGIFGLPVLMALFGCFFHITVTFFNAYTLATNLNEDITVVVMHIIWTMLHLFRLFLVVEPCQRCLCEVEKITFWIYKLLNSGCNDEVEKKLNFLLLYTSKCKIELSACNVVKIRRETLTKIVEAVTTYLVILFQFN